MNRIVEMYDIVNRAYQSQGELSNDPAERDAIVKAHEKQMAFELQLIADIDKDLAPQAQEIRDLWVKGYKSAVHVRIQQIRRG